MSICDRCIHDEVCGLEGNHEEAIAFCSEIMPKTGECQQDHELLKAYSDGANEMLDKIRAKVESINVWALRYAPTYDENIRPQIVSNVKEHVLEIIDKYKAGSEL